MSARIRRYTSAAVAGMMGVSPAYFSARWRGWVEEGKLPKPLMFSAHPKWPAGEIDTIVAARSFEDAPEPARPAPCAVGGDPELAQRAAMLAGVE